MAEITFSPVSLEDRIALTTKQLKTILKLTKGEKGKCDLVGHNPSATVELYIDPVAPATLARRFHISADGTYDSEQCEVPTDDGDWDWAPEGGWVDGPAIPFQEALALLRGPAPKKRKKMYLSDKFTVLDNPDPVRDQQFQFEEVNTRPLHNVWTVVEGDNGKLYAITGFHVVNRLHYVVTEEPWTEEDEGIDYKW